tara:strand:+ start:1035 stop:1808 length:774 start_codon:yes stop_codon:yes gene_type:complete
MPCGLNVSMGGMQDMLKDKAMSFLSMEASLTSVEGVEAYLQGTFTSGLSSITASVSSMIPDIPLSTSGFTSLGDTLSGYISAPSIGGLTSLTSQFGGLSNISGFANINITDLASSALSLSANFDPCSMMSSLGIPDVLSNADGVLSSAPSVLPNIGQTVLAAGNVLEDQSFIDLFAEAQGQVKALTDDMDRETVHKTISANVQTVKSAMSGTMQRLPSGEDKLMKTSDFMAASLVKADKLLSEEEESYDGGDWFDEV